MSTLRQLKIFVTTAEYKKMNLAAKHLFIAQPTISQVISDLEKEYEVTLFERNSKELKITKAGELLLENARKIVSINDALIQDMKNLHSIRPLRIGATMTIGNNIMAKIIKEFNQIYPDIDITVKVTNTAHIELLLLRNELDIALVEGNITHPDILSKPAFLDNLCIISSKTHPFSHKNEIELNDLQNQNFILREKGSGTRAIFENLLKNNRIDYHIKWESASTTAIVDAVINNIGLGVVSKRSIHGKNDLIHSYQIKGYNLQRFFYISTYENHPVTSQMKDFIYFIKSLPQDYE